MKPQKMLDLFQNNCLKSNYRKTNSSSRPFILMANDSRFALLQIAKLTTLAYIDLKTATTSTLIHG